MIALLPVPDAARRLGISAPTLRRLVARGDIPHVRVSPGRVMLREADLDRWIEANVVNGDVNVDLSTLKWVRCP